MALPIRYNFLSLFARKTSTVSSILLIAVVIAAFAYLQAVTDSAFNTMSATGDPLTVMVISNQATSETVSGLGRDGLDKLALTPGAIRDDKGEVVISREMVGICSAIARSTTDDVRSNVAVRGVDFPAANAVREGRVAMLSGRAFEPGVYEVIIGENAAKIYRDYEIGKEIQLGTRGRRMFKIVGVFSTGGTAADSEVWGYVETLRDVYSRGGYSSARLRAGSEQDARAAIEYIKGPSVALNAQTERDYFTNLNTNQTATQVLSVIMIVIMGTAAAFAVANTMYAAVAGRTREIGMLRAIGFARVSILTGFVIEGMLLSFLGGVLGSLLSFVSHGAQRNILPVTFTTVSYSLEITPKIIGTSIAVALAIGLCGSVFPALRAARLSVISSLREP